MHILQNLKHRISVILRSQIVKLLLRKVQDVKIYTKFKFPAMTRGCYSGDYEDGCLLKFPGLQI
jgi:hypothetical protein